jgi:hypothetical protein
MQYYVLPHSPWEMVEMIQNLRFGIVHLPYSCHLDQVISMCSGYQNLRMTLHNRYGGGFNTNQEFYTVGIQKL